MTERSPAAHSAAVNPASPQSPEAPPLPAFHITHWKAGSEWVRAVLAALAPDRFVARQQKHAHLYEQPIRAGGIYTPIYIHRAQFEDVVTVPHERFVVIRDLRDTLVSWYFSTRFSHPVQTNPELADGRANLAHLSEEDGILHVMEERLSAAAKIQLSWVQRAGESGTPAAGPTSGEFIVRYEDLWRDHVAGFERICQHIGVAVPHARLRDVVQRMSFETRSGGRKPGEEDVSSHFRKGVPGDWRNYFTPRITEAFKDCFGQALIATGYERSLDWAGHPAR